jgi:hypothetical protein
MTEPIPQDVELSAEDRLPWHKPEMVLLTISVDTRGEVAFDGATDYSAADLESKGT